MIEPMILEAFPLPDGYVDRRDFAGQVHFGQLAAARPWKVTTGVCLHQTACDMGERIERYDSTGAHIVVLRSGRWIQLHDLDTIIAAANGWNNRTVSIEVNGLFSGEIGGRVWDDPSTKVHEVAMHPTDIQLVRTREIIRWIAWVIAMNGGGLKAIVAHRQSSKARRDDPGQEIWQSCALPLHAELGIGDGGVGFEIGGYAIPESWDRRCTGIKY